MQVIFEIFVSSRKLFRRAMFRLPFAAAYVAAVECALICAFLLRFEFSLPAQYRPAILWAALTWVCVKLPLAFLLGQHRTSWRYFSVPDVQRLVWGNMITSASVGIAVAVAGPVSFPRSIVVLDFCFLMLFTAGAHAAARMLSRRARTRTDGRRSLIYGAGEAGVTLLRETHTNGAFRSRICGFIDDDPAKQGLLIHNTPVLGTGAELARVVARHTIEEVFIAIPSAAGGEMGRIIEHCHAAGVAFRTMPFLSEIISGRGLSRQIRDVAVDDVLGRSAIRLDRPRIEAKLRGHVALVTGAAGSIGSELCRQVSSCNPSALVLLDTAETPLFHIERELRAAHPHVQLHAEIASIQNVQRLREIFALHRPHVVYHAAAYKHVPMMEANIVEAIENNVFGTFNVAVAASDYGADDFVMISSDKAVRPTNIMGATKRVSELVIGSLQNGGPRFVSVRFGNVLGSNGSVAPIFKQQIAAGGPVTVTHPEMRRYFMTIREAVQLVLQASTMGKGGEIFVLDMGTPVKIVDLARKLIVLSGLKPDEDIRIEFSGIRPGEKLYEELRCSDEEVLPTSHEKIKVFAGQCPPADLMSEHLARLRSACERRDYKAAIFELKRIEPDYNPSTEVLQRAFASDLARLAESVREKQAAPTQGSPALARP